MLNSMTPRTVRLTVSEVLDKRKMSTQEFADSAGIAYNTALALRRNSITRLDFPTLARVCSALNVEPGDILITVDSETQ